MSDPSTQLHCRGGHALAPGADWCQECGEPPARASDSLRPADPTDVECPTCGAWEGWACEGDDYGYHAAGYHPARHEAAERRKRTPRAGEEIRRD